MEITKKRRLFFTRQDKLFAIGSPAVVWQIVFFYIPLLLLVISSFFTSKEAEASSVVSFSHFSHLLSRSHFSAIGNSLGFSLITSVCCFLLAFPMALFLAFYGKKYKNLLLMLLIIPFWSNFLLHVYAWFFVLERDGLLNNILMHLNLIHKPLHFLNSSFATTLMMIYCYLPFMVLPIYSALDRFDVRLFEASQMMGASRRQTFFNVLIPLILPSLRAGFFLVFIPAFGEFIIPELMGGNKTFFVGSVVSNYMMGHTTMHLGAGFFLISFIVLGVLSYLIYKGFKVASNKMMPKGLRT